MSAPAPRRLLHTMLRVGDLQRTVDFYTRFFDMKLLRVKDFPDEEYTLAFLGHGPETTSTVIELTYNYGVTKYETGRAYGHVCFAVPDVAADVKRLRDAGVEIMYESDDGFMAFVRDPDGYEVELLNGERFNAWCVEDYAEQKNPTVPPPKPSKPAEEKPAE